MKTPTTFFELVPLESVEAIMGEIHREEEKDKRKMDPNLPSAPPRNHGESEHAQIESNSASDSSQLLNTVEQLLADFDRKRAIEVRRIIHTVSGPIDTEPSAKHGPVPDE